MPAVLALVSSLVWGVADFVGGLAARRSSPLQTLVLTTPAGVLFILPVALLVGGNVTGSITAGVLAGLFGGFGILMLYAAFTSGPMGVVSPLSAVLAAAIPVVVGLVHGERPGTPAYVGMALAVVAIVTVGLEPQAPTDDRDHQRMTGRAFALSIGAGVFIGLFFTLIAFGPPDGGLWPVVFARSVSSVVIMVIAVPAARRSAAPFLPRDRDVRVMAVVAGALDVCANAFYLLAAQTGLLSVVAVLGSLYPAATVVLARLVLAERLSVIQKVGMVTAIVAAALLAVGA